MRSTISFATTQEEIRRTRRQARQRGFDTVSEYLRFLLRSDEGPLISEDEILQRSERTEKFAESGTLVKAASLSEFMPRV